MRYNYANVLSSSHNISQVSFKHRWSLSETTFWIDNDIKIYYCWTPWQTFWHTHVWNQHTTNAI